MKSKRNPWRRLRIIIAALAFVFLVTSVLYSRLVSGGFLTQAGSDILAVIGNFSVGALVALIGIVVLTLCVGRLYCSVLCPLGILQDILGHFHFGKYRNTPWKRQVRGPVFWAVAAAAACGFMLPLTVLLPSSNFVLIFNNALRELIQLFGDSTGTLSDPISVRPMPGVQIAAWGITVVLVVLVQWQGRVFCNTLCPVGAILSVISRKSLYRITLDANKCVTCGACEKVCKAGCIDVRGGMVRGDECVMCMNCLSVCPKGALAFQKTRPANTDFKVERRAFLTRAGAAVAGVALAGTARILPGSTSEIPPAMPPGAGSLERFSARCVGCGLCIGACTGKVLKASVTEYGLRGFQQPVMDPYRGACDFACNSCTQVCPCGALQPLSLTEKRRTRVGIAHWDPSACVAFVDEEDCGACAEHCPVGALTMEEVPGKEAKVPQVNPELCIGCGACQNICPVRPIAAIVVHGVAVQVRVEPPKAEAPAETLKAEEEFPF